MPETPAKPDDNKDDDGNIGAASTPLIGQDSAPPDRPKPLSAVERLLQSRQASPVGKRAAIQPRAPIIQEQGNEEEFRHNLREAERIVNSASARVPQEQRKQSQEELAAAVWAAVQDAQNSRPASKPENAESEEELSPAQRIAASLIAAADAKGRIVEQKDVEGFFGSISGRDGRNGAGGGS